MKFKLYHLGKIREANSNDGSRENIVTEYILNHRRGFKSSNAHVQIDARSDMARELCYEPNPEDL